MIKKCRPTEEDLRHARDEFRSMLEGRAREEQWQSFFARSPYVLSMTLPLQLAPHEIVPMGRPGRTEPDFVFYSRNPGILPTYGVIEIKRPDSNVVTVTRSNVAILSRDAETAVQQAVDYSSNPANYRPQAKDDAILILGNQAHLFVIMGMTAGITKRLSLELYRDMVNSRLPPNLRIIPYDSLLETFEANVPRPLHILVPADLTGVASGEDGPLAESIDRVLLERSIEALPPAERIAIVLHDIEGYDHGEIAEMMDFTVSASRKLLAKARAKLLGRLGLSPDQFIGILKRLSAR